MECIYLKDITPENVIGFAKNGFKEMEALKNNKDVNSDLVAYWRIKYHDVWFYVDRLKKRSQKRAHKLHLKTTKTDVISQYHNNEHLFDEFIKTAVFAGKFLYQLMGMDIEEDGLIPVFYRKGRYIPFTRDIHQALINANAGLTEISLLSEISEKKDKRLNAIGKRKKNFALMVTDWKSLDENYNEVHQSAEDNGLDINLEEFVKDTNSSCRENYPIKSKWLKKLYRPKGEFKFYLFLPMENEPIQRLWKYIKNAKAVSRIGRKQKIRQHSLMYSDSD